MKLGFSFLPIPEEIMADQSLSWGAKFLFGILAKTNKEEIKMSNKYLAERLGCTTREVRFRFVELNKKFPGIISTREKAGRANTYTINIDLVIKIQTPKQVDTPEQMFTPEQTFTPEHGVHTTPEHGVHTTPEHGVHTRQAQEQSIKEQCIKEETKMAFSPLPLIIWNIWNELATSAKLPFGVRTALNRPALTKLLPQCRKITPDIEFIFLDLQKYTEEDFKKAILNYCAEILNRNPVNDYSRHRFSFYDFFKQKNGFLKFLHR
ncbi:MAG: hypothetical protein HY919_02970 [Elusimicrobia bacterium]|nr:hypothetical protein [Elusimicrobiota bacterium]